MKRSREQQIKKLLQQKESCRWEEAEIYSSNVDPEVKIIHLNDLQYEQYCIDQEIDELEHEIKMIPLRVMLYGFIIFAIGMLAYRLAF